MASVLDDYLAQIEDTDLKAKIQAEFDKTSKTFGLVFERHQQEGIKMPGASIELGAKVIVEADDTFHTVVGLDGGTATLVNRAGDERAIDVSAITVAREFGDIMYPGLKPVDEIRNGQPGDPVHTVINGENYHALEILKYTHKGKVDVIYIDPPYNTGNKTWRYNDRYVGEKDSFRHSKWLSFMEKRLLIAKELLKPTGIVFISIDDNEQHRLRMLCDQVFGEQNFIDTIMVELSTTQGMKVAAAKRGTMVKNGEFVHAYRRSDEFDGVPRTPLYDSVQGWAANYSLWLNEDMTFIPLGDHLMSVPAIATDIDRLGLRGRNGGFNIKLMDDLVAGSPTSKQYVLDNSTRIVASDKGSVPPGATAPLWIPGRAYTLSSATREYLLMQSSTGSIRQLLRLSDNYRTSDDYAPKFGRSVIRGDVWKGFYSDMAHVSNEGGVIFTNGKKPIRLIKQLVRWANNATDAVILDFFGGSGTTAHAVMEMNAEDGGKRQAILVTNNELSSAADEQSRAAGFGPGTPEYERHGVFHEVTKRRLLNVVTGVREDGSKYSEGLAANVAFFDLQYLDRARVKYGHEFDSLAGVFWLRAGAHGPLIHRESLAQGFAYDEDAAIAVLFRPGRASQLAAAIVAAPSANLTHVFIVTESDEQGNVAASYFPADLNVERIYGSYLSAFQVNKKD